MTHEPFRFKSREEIESKIAELGLDIPLADDISALFSPLTVAGKTLPNRFVIHPMEGADADPSGGPSDLTFRRYRRTAQGGACLVWFEATAVTEAGRSNPRQLLLTEKTTDGFKRLIEETRTAAREKFGPDHPLLLVLQLTHSGRFSKTAGKPAPVIAQHHPLLDGLLNLPADFPLISDEELDGLEDVFVAASGMAARAGFDGVDIKACHGYLVSELLGCREREKSKYGGSLENRIRFLVETSKKIKNAMPAIFATSRLNVFDALPHPLGFGVDRDDSERHDLSEPIELIEILKKNGLPLLSLGLGIPAFRPHYGRPYDRALIGQEYPPEHPLVGVARWLGVTGRLQKAFPGLPVVGAGYSWLRQFFPHAAAAAVQTGKASLIGLGRMSLAYPDWPNDLAEEGILNSKQVCTTCSKCSQMLRSRSRVGCPVRDAKVYKDEYSLARKRARRLRRLKR